MNVLAIFLALAVTLASIPVEAEEDLPAIPRYINLFGFGSRCHEHSQCQSGRCSPSTRQCCSAGRRPVCVFDSHCCDDKLVCRRNPGIMTTARFCMEPEK